MLTICSIYVIRFRELSHHKTRQQAHKPQDVFTFMVAFGWKAVMSKFFPVNVFCIKC